MTSTQFSDLLTSLQGNFTAVYQELDGQAIIPAVGADTVLEFKNDAFTVTVGGKADHEGLFSVRVHEQGHGAEIALLYKKSTNKFFANTVRVGLLQLEGNTLKLNVSAAGYSAPTSLNTTPGCEAVLTVYQKDNLRPDKPNPNPKGGNGATIW
jgi:uncharacterized protein (TIGR03067 family)